MTDGYVSLFESFKKKEGAKGPSWVRTLRQDAISSFAQLGFPTPRDEDWKYTNVSPITKTPFRLQLEPSANGLSLQKIKCLSEYQIFPSPFPLPSGERVGVRGGAVLVFVNGFYAPKLSRLPSLPEGVRVASLSEALTRDPDKVEPYLARIVPSDKNGFTALNTAFLQDGVFVYLAPGSVIQEPIHLLFISISTEPPMASQPRNLIVLDSKSRASFIESYVSLSDRPSFTNAVTEIVLKEGAHMDTYKIQRENPQSAFHVATTQVLMGRKCRFLSFSFTVGARLARENLNVLLDAEGSECALNGLYLVSDGQHIDHHTLIDHLKPHGTSRQLYKGILEGKSTAVFNGKVFVREGAQKTDAEQTNKNLLLSDEATVDTKPQLEIFNDDVKCTHGAAVGQLDEDAIFYMKSRGMDEPKARTLLTHGFANEIIQSVKITPLRTELDHRLWSWLHAEVPREVVV